MVTLALSGCSSDESLYDAFTNAVTFEVPYTTVSGTLPLKDTGVTQQVMQSSVTLLVLSPGDSFKLPTEWSGGPIASIDWSFAGSHVFNVPVPNGNSNAVGAITLPADLSPEVCAHLNQQCYDLTGEELAIVPAPGPAGGATDVASVSIKLDCSGTHACGMGAGNDLSFTGARDMAMMMPRDMGPPRDMAKPRDMAMPVDLAGTTPDLSTPADLSVPLDLTPPPDLSQTD
jgi:hypothetical protein